MKVLIHILEALLYGMDVLFSSINGIVAMFSKTDHRHKASFGNGDYLSRHNTGFNVNGKGLSPFLSKRGLLISGETGSGKGVGTLVKSCMVVDGSQIIHAPSFELFEKTSGLRSHTDDRIMIFCPTHSTYSCGFNPMLRANTLAEINRLSFLIVNLFTKSSESKSFWSTKAQELLTCLMVILKHDQIGMKYQTLPNVAHLLDYLASESTRPYIDSLFMDLADDWLFQKYDAITSQSDNVFQSIVSTCQSAVQFFDLDDGIRSLVSHDDLGNFDSFRTLRTTLYLVSSTTKGSYYGPLMSILLDQFFESFFSRVKENGEHDVYFHLDESPVLELDNLDVICANIRKHGGAMCLVAQDPYAQLASIYGERKRDAILSNLKTKAYYSVNYDTAKRLEHELGIFSYKDEYDEEKMKTRSLRTASELMQIPDDHVLITQSGEKPLLVPFKPYYQDHPFNQYAELPPYEVHPKEYSSVHLLPLKQMYPNACDHDV